MRYKPLLTAVLLILPLCLNSAADGEHSVRHRPGIQSAFYEDVNGSLTLDEVRKIYKNGGFSKSGSDVMNFGYTSSAYWIRIPVENRADKQQELFLELDYALYDDLYFYFFEGDKLISDKRGGRNYPFSEKDISFRKYGFLINAPAGSSMHCFLRVETSDSMPVPLTIWEMASHAESMQMDMMLLGIYYGLTLIMIFYNIIMFFALKDIQYLYYSGSLLALNGLFQMSINGLSFQYIDQNSIWWSRTSIVVFLGLGLASIMMFTRRFLSLKKELPLVDLLVKFAIVWALVQVLLAHLIDYHYAIQTGVLLAMFVAGAAWIAGFTSLIRGNRSARFYLIGLVSTIVTGMIYALKVWAFIPSSIFTEYAWQAGSAVQAILINIAIADRINFLQQDQMAAREEALSKEKLAREAQEKFSEKLECQVRERTSELNVAVDELKRKEEIVQRELDLAADIQKGILPEESFNFNGIRIEAFYGALEKIGGDFYDYFPVKGDHLCVLISDVSGHGIPASFVTTIAKIYFSEGAARSVFPKDIFRFVNDSLLKTVKTQEYLSAFITVIGPSYEVYYSNASHQKIIRLRKSNREIEEWDTNGLFLGAIAQANDFYEDKSDYLDYGDRLVYYTDGIVEARNSDDVEFGSSRLKELVLESVSMSLADAKAYIVKKFYEFTGDVPLRDDFSFILLEIDSNYRRLLEHKSAGLDHMYHRDYDSAVRQFKIAEEIDQQNESLKLLLGKCFYRMRGFDSAATYLKAYLERNPEDADSWSMLAASLFNLKEYEGAIEAAKMGCHLRPNFIKALQVMAYSYKKTGRDAESTAVWESIIRIDPQNITAIAELEGLKTGNESQEQP